MCANQDNSLAERTVAGLHDQIFNEVISLLPRTGVLDLGAGTGAFANRLTSAGFTVLAADRDLAAYGGSTPFQLVDLDEPSSVMELGCGQWPLITCIEVIEHVESPIALLRGVASLLRPDGIAVFTTPNVDSLAARAKFVFSDRVRLFDKHGDLTHISPIFWDLLNRQYLPRAGLRLLESSVYPRGGFIAMRPAYSRLVRLAYPFLSRRPLLMGDNHILTLCRSETAGVL